MTILLTQQEANDLLALEKYCSGEERVDLPALKGSQRLPLYSADQREEFSLDITRGKALLTKHTFQTRARKVVVLARLDLAGPPHRNPDGKEIDCPHLHLYREGYGDKWAEPLPEMFAGIDDAVKLLDKFMDYCRIVGKPIIERGLFA